VKQRGGVRLSKGDLETEGLVCFASCLVMYSFFQREHLFPRLSASKG
jgi:hypothetical protein